MSICAKKKTMPRDGAQKGGRHVEEKEEGGRKGGREEMREERREGGREGGCGRRMSRRSLAGNKERG